MGKQSERDKEKVKLICQDCGVEYELSYGRYRRLNKEDGHRCKECRYINNAKSASNKYQSLSPEDKKALNAKRAQYWKDPNNRKKKSEDMSNMISNMSPEEKDKWISGMKEYNESLPPELQAIHLINYYKNLSQEEKDELNKRRYDPLKKWKEELSESKRYEFMAKQMFGKKENSDKYTNTELSFMNILIRNNLKYEFQYVSNTIHKDFSKHFNINPITKCGINPFHIWDFKLNLNNKEVLIDIDGSIHDPNKANNMVTYNNGIQFLLSDYINFNDSQRPYQTDGLDAYIVKAYNDIIDDDTIVQNVKTNECIKFKDFMNIISFDNLSNIDKKDLIKLNLNNK